MSKLVEKILQTEALNYCSVDTWNGEVMQGMAFSFLNPVSYIDALKHKELFCNMDGLFADGSLMVLAIKLLYGVKVRRCSFDMTSMAPRLLSYASENGKSLYIVASKQEQVEYTVSVIRKQFEDINIIGYRNGYFASEEEKEQEARHIAKLNPDFLIVGMGVIMQEEFLLKVKDAGYQGIGFTCGGFIHQTAMNGVQYYPRWADKYNLRFIYRMWKEPYTIKRYAKAAIVFPLLFTVEKLKRK